MASLYELTSEYMELLTLAEDPDTDPQAFADTLEGLTGEIEDKADNYAKVLRMLDGDAQAIRDEERRLKARREAIENNIKRMKQMLQFIYSSYSEPIGLDEIAGAAGISPRECSRCFHRAIDRPPIRFLIEYRAQMAAIKLERTDDSISSIAEQCGFLSDSYFGKTFKDLYGLSPRDYRKKHKS